MSMPVPGRAAAIAGATSPSRIRLTRAPDSRSSAIRSSWRSRSSTITRMSVTRRPFASATARTFSAGDAVMSIASTASAPTAIFSMYTAAPGKKSEPRSAAAITAIAFGWPSAVSRVPSRGSTATSTSGPPPSPTASPLKSIGASSFSPSPITTTPDMTTVSSIARIASTAAWSAAFLSPRPIQRPAPIAAASVTRTSSSARFRSGRAVDIGADPRAGATARSSHAFRRLDPDEAEAAGDHRLRRAAEAEPERLRLVAEDAALVVEAVEVVGEADRVRRQELRTAPRRRLAHRGREVGEPLDQLLLLGGERAGRPSADLRGAGVPEDRGDPRVRVLHVVDGVLLRLLGGEVEVDLDRLVGAAVHEVPARGVDADLVHEVVEEHDVAAALRHLRLHAAAPEVDELVEDHLDAGGVVAEHPGDHLVPAADAVVVGAEHVDGAVEAALHLVAQVRDVRRLVRRQSPALGRADQHAVLVVAELGRADPQRALGLVRRQPGEQLRQPLLEHALARPRVEVDAEALERVLDPLPHVLDGIAGQLGQLADVLAAVAVLGRLAALAHRLDRRAEAVHLRAGVVVVVLALDVVAGELEQPRDRVAVRAVARRRDDDRPGRVGGDHLHLHPLPRIGEPAAVAGVDLVERLDEEPVGEPQVEEARAGDLDGGDLLERPDPLGQLARALARGAAVGAGGAQRDVRRVVAVRGVVRPLEHDVGACERAEARGEAVEGGLHGGLVSSPGMDDGHERQLNIHMDPDQLAGVYANFANITFSDYEFTITFARLDHEVEQGDVPGVVVARVNMSQRFTNELLTALQDAWSKYTTVKGILDLHEKNDHRE